MATQTDTTTKIEQYITQRELEGTKAADVLREYSQGHSELGHICWFHGYSLDHAVAHLDKAL